ncbi:hypothetical protein S245_060551, partial [Arachis hypogaea]
AFLQILLQRLFLHIITRFALYKSVVVDTQWDSVGTGINNHSELILLDTERILLVTILLGMK